MPKKTVIIIGAGCSVDLAFNSTNTDLFYGSSVTTSHEALGPLSNGFFFFANVFCVEHGKKISGMFQNIRPADYLLTYVTQYYESLYGESISKEEILLNKEKSIKINIEALFINLHKEMSESEKLDTVEGWSEYGRKASLYSSLKDYVHNILSSLSKYTLSIYHSYLSKYALLENASVISFNWDVLFEDRLNDLPEWNYETGYGLSFSQVIDMDGRMRSASTPSMLKILKPHGSINWYKERNGKEIYLCLQDKIELRGGNPRYLPDFISLDDKSLHPSIIPPSEKASDMSLAIKDIWRQVKIALEEADEIIVIGYSFNSFDEYVMNEVGKYNFKEPVRVTIVDPRHTELKPHLSAIFKTAIFSESYNSLKDFVYFLKQKFTWS